ncbi:MAG: hypothetical protein QF638_01865, partial [Acidimicrobiales bacterium]|nr:hypothetical protein [Acidimicrobiales bacterium]
FLAIRAPLTPIDLFRSITFFRWLLNRRPPPTAPHRKHAVVLPEPSIKVPGKPYFQRNRNALIVILPLWVHAQPLREDRIGVISQKSDL